MMFKGSDSQGQLNGFLIDGSHMTGELFFEDTFRIEGRFTGTIVSKGELQIGENGDIDGEIKVSRVVVSGTVRGSLRASERVDVTKTGKVLADVYTPSLTIDEGAFFEGRCSMERLGGEKKDGDRKKVAQMPFAKTVK